MLASLLSTVGGLFTWAGQLLGVIKKTQELRNTPEMQKNASAKKDAEMNDRINRTIQKEDVKGTQTLLSR